MTLIPLFQQLHGLVETPGNASFAVVVSTLDLDMSAATVKQMRDGDFVITEGKRQIFPFAPSIVVTKSRRKRMIFLLLEGPDRLAYTEYLMAGLSTKIMPSKHDGGFSIVASIGAVQVGCTVSTADQCIESIFCEVMTSVER